MSDPKSRRSFSPVSRLQIGFDKIARTLLMLAVVVMVNYLGAQFTTGSISVRRRGSRYPPAP